MKLSTSQSPDVLLFAGDFRNMIASTGAATTVSIQRVVLPPLNAEAVPDVARALAEYRDSQSGLPCISTVLGPTVRQDDRGLTFEFLTPLTCNGADPTAMPPDLVRHTVVRALAPAGAAPREMLVLWAGARAADWDAGAGVELRAAAGSFATDRTVAASGGSGSGAPTSAFADEALLEPGAKRLSRKPIEICGSSSQILASDWTMGEAAHPFRRSARACAPVMSVSEGIAMGAGALLLLLLVASAGPLALVLAFAGTKFFPARDDQEGVQPTLGIDTETYGALKLDTEEAGYSSGSAKVRRAPPPQLSAVDRLELSEPSQAESEAMGLRDWPSTVLGATFEETCAEGSLRYVLEGEGILTDVERGQTLRVAPNTLVRVNVDDAVLSWSLAPECAELVLLTPEYRGPPLLPVAAGFLLLCTLLVAATSTGGS